MLHNVTNLNKGVFLKGMVRYKRNIKSGVVRIPQEVKEAFGDEIIMLPNLKSMAIYPAMEKKENVIRSLQLIIRELKQELEGEEEDDRG